MDTYKLDEETENTDELSEGWRNSWRPVDPKDDPLATDVDHLESWHATKWQKEYARSQGIEFIDIHDHPPEFN